MSDDIEPADVEPEEPTEPDQLAQAAAEPEGPAGRRGLGDQLARVRMSPGQLQTAMALCIVVSLGAFLIAWAGFSSRVDVARTEARRAVEESAATRALIDAADCGLLDAIRVLPGDPPRQTASGQLMAERAEKAAQVRGCP